MATNRFNTLIDASTLSTHLEDPDWMVFDCRFSLANPDLGKQEYKEGHIPGSVYLHLNEDLSGKIIPGLTGRHPLTKPKDFIQKLEKTGLSSDMQVVAYDHGSGGIAARLWWMLNWLNLPNVAVLNGGWTTWAQNFPVESHAPKSRDHGKIRYEVRKGLWVEADFVDQIKKVDDYTIVDSRSPTRYRGEEEPIDPVAGHIPGAINLPFKENLETSTGLWKTADMLRQRFEKAIHFKKERTIFYCGSGVTACHNLLAYKHAGLGMARLYPGSWSEWITDSAREIEKGIPESR